MKYILSIRVISNTEDVKRYVEYINKNNYIVVTMFKKHAKVFNSIEDALNYVEIHNPSLFCVEEIK